MTAYTGRTPKEEYKQLMTMLDNVFFLNDSENPPRRFLTLLPKLYKEKYDPCYNNFCVMEDGVIKAAVGLYPLMAQAAGHSLKVGGIGNVAVARDARRHGYMITAMNMCLEQMKSDGTDFSVLGGQRQRYGFFGYEPAGVGYAFRLDAGNIIRQISEDYEHPYTVREITPDDTGVLQEIMQHFASFPLCYLHDGEDAYDVLSSWHAKPFAAFKDGVLKGHFSVNRSGELHEFYPFNAEDAFSMAIAAVQTLGKESIEFNVPLYNTELAEVCAAKMGGMNCEHVEMINILCYENFIRAFLCVKAAYETLCDGKTVMLIHGYKCDEQLLIEVKDNTVKVEPTTESPEIEIGHREAIRMIASLCSIDRFKLPANVRSWFPLPFYISSHDGV